MTGPFQPSRVIGEMSDQDEYDEMMEAHTLANPTLGVRPSTPPPATSTATSPTRPKFVPTPGYTESDALANLFAVRYPMAPDLPDEPPAPKAKQVRSKRPKALRAPRD